MRERILEEVLGQLQNSEGEEEEGRRVRGMEELEVFGVRYEDLPDSEKGVRYVNGRQGDAKIRGVG